MNRQNQIYLREFRQGNTSREMINTISHKDWPHSSTIEEGIIGFKDDTVPVYEGCPYGSVDHCRSAQYRYRKHSNALRIIAQWRHKNPDVAESAYLPTITYAYID